MSQQVRPKDEHVRQFSTGAASCSVWPLLTFLRSATDPGPLSPLSTFLRRVRHRSAALLKGTGRLTTDWREVSGLIGA